MSSLRNAVPRPSHRERAQPRSRQRKYGLLEKHKDYSLRAADYNLKKQKLAQLSNKARERHPDEFAFGMHRDETAKAGKHGMRGSANEQTMLSHDAVQLLKRQDSGYLRVAMAQGRKDVEKMKGLVGMDEAMKEVETSNKGLNDDELVIAATEGQNGDSADFADISPKNISKKAIAAKIDALKRVQNLRRKREKLQALRINRLEALKKRQKEIMAVADQLDLQRAKMAGTIGGVNKNGVKFKIRERKR